MKALRLFATAAVSALLAVSCGLIDVIENEFGTAELTGLSINQSLVYLQKGESTKLALVPEPSNAKAPEFTWATYDENITLAADGTVTAEFPGNATVYALDANGEVLFQCYVYVYDTIYSIFKDGAPMEDGPYYGSTFVRYWFFMTELKGDNASWSGRSEDPMCASGRYMDNPSLRTNRYMWTVCYKIIDIANTKLEKQTGLSNFDKGELLFLRAYSYYCLVTLFAKQYVLGRDNPGVPLVLSAGQERTSTATVGEVYDQIVSDLQEAASLMAGTVVTDKGKASDVAAKALLSRVYLYMEKNQECLEICNSLLSQYSSVLDNNLDDYFKNAKTSKETIWCIAHNPEDSKEMGSIGSLYYSPDGIGCTGWGEIYWTEPLIELFQRYPADKRFKAYFYQNGRLGDGTKMVCWPIDEGSSYGNRSDALVYGEENGLTPDANGVYHFTYNGKDYSAVQKSVAGVNNGYPQYFIDYEGEQTQVFIRDNVGKYSVRMNGGTFPAYFMTKFSGQDGDSNLSSPVILRWAEVYLNRAEACAKLGRNSEALADVNVLRARAGLDASAFMTEANLASRGYASVLDAVLDERRMELCFEGHRTFDVYRNKQPMDRRFAGINTWEVIDYTDDCIPYQKPE